MDPHQCRLSWNGASFFSHSKGIGLEAGAGVHLSAYTCTETSVSAGAIRPETFAAELKLKTIQNPCREEKMRCPCPNPSDPFLRKGENNGGNKAEA